ncbi:MAG: Ig domain-containing protein [bacterium JZ-2024 1]
MSGSRRTRLPISILGRGAVLILFLAFMCNPGKIDIWLTPTVLPDARVGQPYSVTFVAGGGTKPYTFTAPSQGIPPGLAFAQVTSTEAKLEGTPQAQGQYTFVVAVCDAFAKCVSRGYLLRVLASS